MDGCEDLPRNRFHSEIIDRKRGVCTMAADILGRISAMEIPPKPLRILFLFSGIGLGGAEQSMFRMIRAACPKDFECIVVARRDAAVASLARQAKVPFHALAQQDLRGYVRIFRQTKPDIVYLFGRIRTILWAIAAKIARVPCIVAAERSSAKAPTDAIARFLDRWLVDAYVANSQMASVALRRWVGPNHKIYVVPNGIAFTSELCDRDMTQSPPLGPVLLCIANLTENKGQVVLAQAANQLRTRYPNLRVLLVGRDHTHGKTMAQITQLGLDSFVEWKGFQSDCASYLHQADVFVLPSLFREGMPTSILEAMVARVPIVASNIGGVSELVQPNVTGLLVPPGNVEILGRTIAEILDDESTRRRIVDAAYSYALSHHTLEKMITSHLHVFQDALR